MKNFDIEKMERINAFKTPESFFPEVQNKVLSQTVFKENRTKVFKLDFKWAAAAAVILIAGLTAFFFTDKQDPASTTIADTEVQKTTPLAGEQTKSEEMIAYETVKNDLTSVEKLNQKEEEGFAENNAVAVKQPVGTQKNKTKSETVTEAEQIDQLLAVFTEVELSEISKNSDQDVYLDLYN
ncbi:hypothetical protein [Chryseobacterium sp.]|uniref:hypothetical protein n=1 Tax=Chryseobacterium sp. TaxID=1871047 RepID=UPI0011CC4C1A|nr:hypothetical protein [Chryseobacterium sp.]TXF76002.1 hypothetical protein FUA25_08880 [Chryseobacterium sp.]